MLFLRILCVTMFAGIVILTVAAIEAQGLDLVTPFVSEIIAMSWSGQFNFDFMCYLTLSALWFLWRNEFSPAAILFSPFILFGGILVLAPYLFVLSFRVDNRFDVLLIGRGRVQRLQADA